MPAFNPSASQKYLKLMAGRGQPLVALSQEMVEEIIDVREGVRQDEGGGGMCHIVTEILQARYGWGRLSVTYLSTEGEVICGGGHVVNLLPDGSILDSTRDQFGEGHSVSLISARSAEIGRYRTEFYEDFHPLHPDADGRLDGWLDTFDGRMDYELETDLVAERGQRWWLRDRTLIDSYDARQEAYARGEGNDEAAAFSRP